MELTDLSDLTLADPNGNPVRLGDVVDRPTIINLVRYYGCAPCRRHLLDLAARYEEISAAGGEVLGVGPHASYQARLLMERGRVPFRLLLDPDHRVGRAVGLERQSLLRWLFDLRAWWRWVRAFITTGQGLVTGGWWEVPGVVVVDARCRVRWAHRGRSMGDYPPLEETLAHLRRLTAPASP